MVQKFFFLVGLFLKDENYFGDYFFCLHYKIHGEKKVFF